MTTTPRLLLALALLSAQGCVLGRVRDEVPLDADKVAQIVPGTTTKKQCVDLLGAPTYVNDRIGLRVVGRPEETGEGNIGPVLDELVRSPLDHSYTWEYSDTKSASAYLLLVTFTNTETRRDRVVVFFDERGVVSHVGKSLNAGEVEFRFPMSDDDPDEEDE